MRIGWRLKPISERLPALEVSFADPAWTGNTIPAGQHCQMFGGKGQTPALKVGKIPAGANAIIVEFNDLSFGPLSWEVATARSAIGSREQVRSPAFRTGRNGRSGRPGQLHRSESTFNRAICLTGLPSPVFWRARQHLRGGCEGCVTRRPRKARRACCLPSRGSSWARIDNDFSHPAIRLTENRGLSPISLFPRPPR